MKKFNSLDEYIFYKQLDALEINYEKNIKPLIIDEGFKTKTQTYRDAVYTPDAIIYHNDRVIYVEIKGFSLYDKPFKYRITQKKLKSLGYEFHKIKYSGSMKDLTKGFYSFKGGSKSKALKNKSDSKKKVKKQWFFQEEIISKDKVIPIIKNPKMYYYEEIKDFSNCVVIGGARQKIENCRFIKDDLFH